MGVSLKYRLRCVDEDTYQYIILNQAEDAPKFCPNDQTHTVDLSHIAIVDIIESNN